MKLFYAGYYTHFSFLLFIISFCFPFTSYIKTFILLNSIVVGIAGNFIHYKDYEIFKSCYKDTYPDMEDDEINNKLLLGNLIFHTLPMIVSCILLIYCTSFINNYKDACTIFLYQLCIILIWSLIPYQNKIFEEKIISSYPSAEFSIVITYSISIFLFFIMASLKYF